MIDNADPKTPPHTSEQEIEQWLGSKTPKSVEAMTYDDWLEYFRKIPAGITIKAKEWLNMHIPSEGFAAASRWIEIIGNPTRMDKLYQGRLKAETKESIMDLAVGDDDVAFYEALIRENVIRLDESRNSTQEVARLTQNLNIFRAELRDARSRSPKKGSVLERVLQAANEPPKPAPKPKKKATKKKSTKKKVVKNESKPKPTN